MKMIIKVKTKAPMKATLKNEWFNILVTATPFLYLAYVWKSLPDKVPVHWNMAGEIDRYGSKTELLIVPFLLPLLTYLIFLAIPYIDPKKQIEKMGNKYHQLKFIFVCFTSLIAIYVIYASSIASLTSVKFIYIGLALIIAVLGNYMQSIKPNYFMGFRTPWTLENNEVWKLTHRLAGKMWVVGGITIGIFTLLLNDNLTFWVLIIIISIISIIPLIYSYVIFKKLDNE